MSQFALRILGNFAFEILSEKNLGVQKWGQVIFFAL